MTEDLGNSSDIANEKRGAKYNKGKNRMGLMSPFALWMQGRLYTIGAVKYGPHNFRKSIPFSETLDAILRHLVLFWMGEQIDSEGINHLDAISWNVSLLREQTFTHPEMNDLYKFPVEAIERFKEEEKRMMEGFEELSRRMEEIKQVEQEKLKEIREKERE